MSYHNPISETLCSTIYNQTFQGSRNVDWGIGVDIKYFWGLSLLVNIMGVVESDQFEINLHMNQSLNIFTERKILRYFRSFTESRDLKMSETLNFQI